MVEHRQHVTDLKGGQLQIYMRSDTIKPLWQARANHPNRSGFITKSLKTTDKDTAIERAEEWFDELRFKERNGLVVHSRSVSSICDLYIKDLTEAVQAGVKTERHLRDYKAIADRYVRAFFGQKHIDNVKQGDIAEFDSWCRAYWVTGDGSREKNKVYYRDGKRIVSPTPRRPKGMSESGMANVFHVLRDVFRTGVKYDAIREADFPLLTLKKKARKARGGPSERSRSAFTKEEFRQLYMFLRHWHRKTDKPEQSQRRELLRDYVLVLANTGLRPGTETDGLCWKHVEYFKATDGKEYPRLIVSGKTGERQTVVMPNVKRYLERIRKRRADELGSPPPLSEPVFCLPDGQHIRHDYLRSLFERALKEADLLYDAAGRKRVLYSCRHTYATFRLLYGRVSVYTLAENMGTSVGMIEKHYGHLTPTLAAAELTQIVKPS